MHEPRDLIDAMRRVNTAARIAELDGEDFTSEIQQLQALADRLDALAVDNIRMQAALWHDDLAERMAKNLTAGPKGRINRALEVGIAGFFPYSPYVGTLNPIAPPIDFATVEVGDRAEVNATHKFEAIMNGPPGGVHGGVVAGVFDELLGCTGTLSIRYASLTPLGVPITMRGWVDRVEGRKTFATGTFHHGETLCATAEGIFIGPRTAT
jgi:acyl-coenzyme A thioesterase PaaI-like protein